MFTQAVTLAAGSCRHAERVVWSGGRLRPITMPSLVGALKHSSEGWVLFDTGHAPRFATCAGNWLYRMVAPYRVAHSEGAAAQLAARGVPPEDVRHVVLSHLHPDHIGGAKDFPNATYHLSNDAWRTAGRLRGWRKLFAAWFPALLPDDFLSRVNLIRSLPDQGFGPFRQTADLFGDGSLKLVGLPGHAAGQLGMMVNLVDRQRLFFAADACWISESFKSTLPPSRLTRFIVDDYAESLRTLDKLHQLWRQHPDIRIIPAHCPSAALGDITIAAACA